MLLQILDRPSKPATEFAGCVLHAALLRGGAWHASCSIHYEREGKGMADELKGKRIAFLATDGVEEVELTLPWDALAAAGADLELVASSPGEINATHRRAPADSFMVDTVVAEADVADYDGLVLPRGVAMRGRSRSDPEAVHFVRAFLERDKPVASIAEAPPGDLPAFCAKAIALFAQSASRP